jgi:hypothetical protein
VIGPGAIVADGHGFLQALFPLAAAVIAFLFALRLGDLARRKHRPQDTAWFAAMLMFAVASFVMFMGVLFGWTSAGFRVYWLFGAVLNVPFLFAGEAYLLFRRRLWADVVMAVTVVLAIFATVVVLRAPVDQAALDATLPLGKDVFGSTLAHGLAQIYGNTAYGLLLLGLLWSMFRMRGRPELKDTMTGILLIAVGASVVAVGSGIGAAFGFVALFSAGLAAGIAIMFAGFLRASRPRATV